ncbi:MAG: flagellar basal body L-ring protein FlgH [Phycisphaerales bacterium]|nr:flagellar basal body L-ring protein FlgH [Phycisphaerales bacterium]
MNHMRTTLTIFCLPLLGGLHFAAAAAVSNTGHAPAEAPPVVLPRNGGESPEAVRGTPGMSIGGLLMQAANAEGISVSLVAPEEMWEEEDLLQIIVRETSNSKIQQERELEKEGLAKAEVGEFSSFDFGAFAFSPTTSAALPGVEIGAEKEFNGEGDYSRKDEMTDRITARVVEVKPNGNLVIEARVIRDWSGDRTEIRLTGVVDPDMITAAKTIISNQIYDLKIEKIHSGPVEESTQRGFLAEVLDFLFAF